MNRAKIIYCLSNIMDIDFNDDSIDIPSHEEREVAEHLAEIIISFCNLKQFAYEQETTLDFFYDPDDDDGDGFEEEEDDDTESDSDYNDEDDSMGKYPKLTSYSIEFMQKVVDFVDEKGSSGKCRRTWKSIHHRFRSLPNQGYISRFRKYLEQNGTRNQKLEEIDIVVYQKLIEAREKDLPLHDIDLQR